MIVTRTWLNNFIDISGVSDEKLCETLTNIGLEVDNIKTYTIPPKVVVGRILSCEKHPDADKLNVCQIDVGHETLQIVCGAANVVNAKYVAVATVGAKLGENFEIKHANLRGVESAGMVCSASELGLPDIGNGIMILDESIGKLVVGKELNEYKKVADTVIELELTANRGDCLSIHGVARDLGAALDIPMKHFDYESQNQEKIGLAREAELKTPNKVHGSLKYMMADVKELHDALIFTLRLAFIEAIQENALANLVKYVTHTTGVIMRAYKTRDLLCNEGDKITITASLKEELTHIEANGKFLSILGVLQNEASKADDQTVKVLFEASYIEPQLLVDAVANKDLPTDDLFYNSSRGSEPDLTFGTKYLMYLLESYSGCNFFDGSLSYEEEVEAKIITISEGEISQLIGQFIDKGEILRILSALGFRVQNSSEEIIGIIVPRFRHDIENIQDIAEEVLRITGINNIQARPLKFVEAKRINRTSERYHAKKALRQRSIAMGFFESVSYAFCDRNLLVKYGFPRIKEALDIINPITEDLNTLRSTILINLLQAGQRNVNYSKRTISLFEVGTIFNENRQEKEVVAFLMSGQAESENVSNHGKPQSIDFETFTKKLSGILGNFQLRNCSTTHELIHPYQSADIIINGAVCGYLSKLHPSVAEDFDLGESFIAEIDMDALLPQHINAHPISKFQGVYKDLSLVVDQNIPFNQLATVIDALRLPLLKKYYPIDVYEDEALGEQKSITIRLFIQSQEQTLNEEAIEQSVTAIVEALNEHYGATLR